MTDDLRSAVMRTATGTESLSDDARSLLYGALVSADRLADAVNALPLSADAAEVANSEDATDSPSRAAIFLRSLSVAGFRGIAGKAEISLDPAPGLTLITGRNGSGKSSLAEACELALTGQIFRATRAHSGGDGLSNLHTQSGAQISLTLDTGETSDVVIDCGFDGGEIANPETTARSGSETIDLERYGWSDAVARYRPILSYGELSALASSKPSDLFDPINNIVGLDPLTVADQLLMKAKSEQSKIAKEAGVSLDSLLSTLGDLNDPRAAELVNALSGKTPDLNSAREIMAGVRGPSAEDRRRLEIWSALEHPDPELASQAAQNLEAARLSVEAASSGNSGRLRRLAEMLDLAVANHDHSGETCPVCGQGRLDEAWLASARERSREARDAASGVESATHELKVAQQSAQSLVAATPTSLAGGDVLGVNPASAAHAWDDLKALTSPNLKTADRDHALITRLPGLTETLATEVSALRTAASEALRVQNTAWEPIAEQVGETLKALDRAAIAKVRGTELGVARTWLGELTSSLRQERVRQFEVAATGIWKGLQQESNVTLEGVALVGANTRRNVKLDLMVDGTPGPQAVLSQGELAALGLALFLPRSTAAESPFRFVLIDDPVQSMDPSKVDGLARVLHKISQDRQVVVLTHDDRLMHSLRNLALPVTAFQVVRGEKSAVEVRQLTDVVDQLLQDARDLSKKSRMLPIDLVAVAVAGCCRDAIDETALGIARKHLRSNGVQPVDVEERLSSARTTWERIALALCSNKNHTGEKVNALIDAKDPEARKTIVACVHGVHEPEADKLRQLPDQVQHAISVLHAVHDDR